LSPGDEWCDSSDQNTGFNYIMHLMWYVSRETRRNQLDALDKDTRVEIGNRNPPNAVRQTIKPA
jgi:hypothetical protein